MRKMKNQTEESTSNLKAKKIVKQLVEIAKKNNAMDVIGASTSWRWQEGLISKMPKTKTVTAILSKAFNTSDPREWLGKVPRELSWFIKTNILKSPNFDEPKFPEVNDVFEVYFLVTWTTNATKKEEVIFGLCYYKFASSIEDDVELYENPNLDRLLLIYGSWAHKKYQECLSKFEPSREFIQTNLPHYSFISSESYTRKLAELGNLRNRIVGFSSIHDMWNSVSFRVSDEEHIEIEKEMKAFYEKMKEKYMRKGEKVSNAGTRLRTYTINAIIYPAIGDGVGRDRGNLK